ncbi:MAG TPA: hypothetical protein DCQ94_06550 [Nitrospira sp.]|nr:hypothetical protein [Nitrospira sp.]HRI82505.1 GntR family transcriptional regulator [Opitutaceae bacterium]HRJ48486.1 GntR family transcriptional regulator [Opitutaceae bacterium]
MKPQGALRPDPDLPSGGLLRLQSRAEQLADYLRAQWQRGALQEPLPGSRDWSRKLGVSRSTLDAALKLLAHEKWLEVTGRGVCLRRQQPDGSRRRRPAVKWLLEGTSQPVAHNYLAVAAMVQNRLRLKGIEVDWEVCSPGRIREIARHPVRDRLHILASLRPAFQRLFNDAGQPALVLGEVAAGLNLPFINVDLSGAVRHAVFELLRTGCTRLELVHLATPAVGIAKAEQTFTTAVEGWTPRIPSRILCTGLDRPSLLAVMRRLVASQTQCLGCIVVAPVPVGMVVSVLLEHGLRLPQQVKVAAVFHAEDAVNLCPPLLHYPWPGPALAAKISAMAEAYFARGQAPASRTLTPVLNRIN